MTNIRAVSKLAGVSTATVSRTLTNPELVSLKTRKLVLEAVEQSGYRPNLLARNFNSGKSYSVVVLVPNISNPFFSKVIRGIEQSAQEKGYSVLLGDTQDKPEREKAYASMGLTNQADGLIQLDSRYPFSKEDESLAKAFPFVNACERISDDGEYPVVELDNHAAGRTVAKYLLALGHRRIAVITGPRQSPIVKDRLRGFNRVLEEQGVSLDPALIANGDFSMPSGLHGVNTLLKAKQPPTAIFCFNDEMAIGAIHGIKKAGLKVPEDISIVGFDNIEVASFTDPALTTVNQPAEELGRQAMNLLYQLIIGKKLTVNHMMLPFELIERQSSAHFKGSF